MITVLIADDNRMVRRGLRSILEDTENVSIAGEVSTGLEAIQWVQETPVDVVLMDIRMPGMDGITATKEILRIRPGVKVLVLTIVDEAEVLSRAIAAGAQGCLIYDRFIPETLPKRICDLVSGNFLVTMPSSALESSFRPNVLQSLTKREREILGLIRAGKTNREISETIHIHEWTVRTHIYNLYMKLGLTSRYQAIRLKLDGLPDYDG